MVSPGQLPAPCLLGNLWCPELCIFEISSNSSGKVEEEGQSVAALYYDASVKAAACNGDSTAAEITPESLMCHTGCIIYECLMFKSILVKIYTLCHQFKVLEETLSAQERKQQKSC